MDSINQKISSKLENQNKKIYLCKVAIKIMNYCLTFGFICSLLLVSLAGVCMAAESPSYEAYIQGGESSMVNGTDGIMVVTVKELVPYFNIANGKKSLLLPVERLTNITYPVNAAIVFSGADNESTFRVEVSNLSLSERNKALIVQVKPLEFYEGSLLNNFTSEKKNLSVGSINGIGFYLEINEPAFVNSAFDVLTNNELAQTIADLK